MYEWTHENTHYYRGFGGSNNQGNIMGINENKIAIQVVAVILPTR